MKKIVFFCIISLYLVPAWGQLYSPKQIEELQDFYLHYETHREKAKMEMKEVKPPYKLPQIWVGGMELRPKGFKPYFYNGKSYKTNNTLRDTLRFEGRDILIFDSPLLDFPEIESIVLPNKLTIYAPTSINLDAYRGYTAQWRIENDSLFLIRVNPFHKGGYFWGDTVSWMEIYPEIEELTGQTFIGGKLFAAWVNGWVVGGINGIYLRKELEKYELEKLKRQEAFEMILRKQYTGHYIYPEEFSFQVKQGIIKKIKHRLKE